MTENIDPIDRQLEALMHVITQITKQAVPLTEFPRDLITNKNIRKLEEWANEYSFTDGDLVDDLKSTIIELKYLLVVIKDLQERVEQGDIEIRSQQLRLNENQVEMQRLENLVHRAN